jgi:DNA end-binding protein Ku
MAARAYWKGHIRLSLVTIGVELFSAVTSSSKLAFHQIHKPSGKRIRYQKVAPGLGPVQADDIVKGYEIGKDRYVLFDAEELDNIKLESKHTIDLVQFVEHCEIDPRYFAKPYYIVPAENRVALEGYSVIREALRSSKKVALGQMASRGRDYIVAIKPCGAGLLLETLRFADEVRASDSAFNQVEDVEIDDEMLQLANQLIDRKTAQFDAGVFKSQYLGALQELIDEKRKTGEVKAASDEELEARTDNVIDLMSALKRSVARDTKAAPGTRGSAKKRKPAGTRKTAAKKTASGRKSR